MHIRPTLKLNENLEQYVIAHVRVLRRTQELSRLPWARVASLAVWGAAKTQKRKLVARSQCIGVAERQRD